MGTARWYSSSETMLPNARIGSTFIVMIAAGATPVFILSVNVALDVLDPLPRGRSNMRPVTICPVRSWRRSIISPVCGDNPPHKLRGSLLTARKIVPSRNIEKANGRIICRLQDRNGNVGQKTVRIRRAFASK